MKAPQLSPVQVDRAAGVLLGAACGDALGVPHEPGAPPAAGEPVQIIGDGPGPDVPGECSGDTQTAVCIAEVAAGGADLREPAALDQIAAGFVRLGVLARTGPEAGSGSLLRTAPVALSRLEDPQATAEAARAVSELTHHDPIAGDACVLWCEGIRHAVLNGGFAGVRHGIDLLPADRRDQWVAWLDEAEQNPPERFVGNGFVVVALQAAWSSITQTPVEIEDAASGRFPCRHLRDSLHTAARLGKDADKAAAVMGALLGAGWGASAVPLPWQRLLHRWERPRAPDLIRLGLMIAGGGRGMPTGRPGCDWAGDNRPGLVMAHHDDAGVLLSDGPVLDTDAVVSLCGVDHRYSGVEADKQVRAWLVDPPAGHPNGAFVVDQAARMVAQWRADGVRVLLHGRPALALAAVAARYSMLAVGAAADSAVRATLRSFEHQGRPIPDGLAPFIAAFEADGPSAATIPSAGPGSVEEADDPIERPDRSAKSVDGPAVEAAIRAYIDCVRHPDPRTEKRLQVAADVDARALVDSFAVAEDHPYWAYQQLPVPHHRVAQALDAYASCLADGVERRVLLRSPLYRRYRKFLIPSWPWPDGSVETAACRAAYRRLEADACRVIDAPAAWGDLSLLEKVLADDEASGARHVRDTEVPGHRAVLEYVGEVAWTLEADTADMLATFAVEAAADTLDADRGVRAWRPVIEEALCLYLSLLASGVTVSLDGLAPAPTDSNEFPHDLTDPRTWRAIRLWKFRPSPYLQELFGDRARTEIEHYVAAVRALTHRVEQRTSAESPTAPREDFQWYPAILRQWSDCPDPAALERHVHAWPKWLGEQGAPFHGADPALLESVAEPPPRIPSDARPPLTDDRERDALLEELARSRHDHEVLEAAAAAAARELSDLGQRLAHSDQVVTTLRRQLAQAGEVESRLRAELLERAARAESTPPSSGPVADGGPPAPPNLDGVDLDRLQRLRDESRVAREILVELDEAGGEEGPGPNRSLMPQPALPVPVRELAERLAMGEQHTLQSVRILSGQLGLLLPLDAIRLINDWAGARLVERNLDAEVSVVEVDARADIVYVDNVLGELLT
jgi:ADP-ribosylglycohydrolase